MGMIQKTNKSYHGVIRESEEHEFRERQLESKIQYLTEENDILKRENDLNNGWVENQDDLRNALENSEQLNATLRSRVNQLETTL